MTSITQKHYGNITKAWLNMHFFIELLCKDDLCVHRSYVQWKTATILRVVVHQLFQTRGPHQLDCIFLNVVNVAFLCFTYKCTIKSKVN